eukprot:COSAG04_NODE_2719_length_3683_cov_28.055804_2_plen_1005_part_01
MGLGIADAREARGITTRHAMARAALLLLAGIAPAAAPETGAPCEAIGLVECGSGDGAEIVCATSCPGGGDEDAELCGLLGLTPCGVGADGEVNCVASCPHDGGTDEDTSVCELLGLVECGDGADGTICAPVCGGGPEPGPTDELCASLGLVLCGGASGGAATCAPVCDEMPAAAASCELLGLVECSDGEGVVCAPSCGDGQMPPPPTLAGDAACQLFGLVECSDGSGGTLCVPSCGGGGEPEPEPGPTEAVCALLGLVLCDSDGTPACAAACDQMPPAPEPGSWSGDLDDEPESGSWIGDLDDDEPESGSWIGDLDDDEPEPEPPVEGPPTAAECALLVDDDGRPYTLCGMSCVPSHACPEDTDDSGGTVEPGERDPTVDPFDMCVSLGLVECGDGSGEITCAPTCGDDCEPSDFLDTSPGALCCDNQVFDSCGTCGGPTFFGGEAGDACGCDGQVMDDCNTCDGTTHFGDGPGALCGCGGEVRDDCNMCDGAVDFAATALDAVCGCAGEVVDECGTCGGGVHLGTEPGDVCGCEGQMVDLCGVCDNQEECDRTPPEVMWVGAESDGADAHFAKAGDMISASIKMSEAVRSEMGVWLVVAEGMEASPTVYLSPCAMLGLTPCAGPEGEITCAASCSDDEVRVDGCADGWCWRAMEYVGESVEGSIVMYDFVYSVESDVHFQGVTDVRIGSLVDIAGNVGDDASWAGEVSIDVVAPEVEVLSVSSSGAHSGFAAAGDVITVTVSASESIVEPTVSMVYYEWEGCSDGCEEALSLSPYVSQDAVGSSFQFAYMVDEASPEGIVEHMVREVFDLASNEMVDGSLTSLDLVTIDTTLPSVLSVEIASDNELPELAIVGDTITVRIELVEYSSTPHIELVQVDGAGCSDGCTVSMDVVHAVASSDGSGVIDGETCAQLGLVACASGAGVTVCVPDGSECGGHDESRDAGWSDHESTCSALGLALCSVIDGVPLCVPDDSGCSDAGAAPARRERPLVFAQAYEATYTVTES